LKRPDMAKSSASPRMRVSGESPSKRGFSFRFPFVSFRPVSPALGACRGEGGGERRLSARSARTRGLGAARLAVHPATACRLPRVGLCFNQSID
jgi:hypothetical protein